MFNFSEIKYWESSKCICGYKLMVALSMKCSLHKKKNPILNLNLDTGLGFFWMEGVCEVVNYSLLNLYVCKN